MKLVPDPDTNWSQFTRRAVVLAAVAAFILVLWAGRSVVSTIVIAAVLAFLVDPVITWLHRHWRIPRGLGALFLIIVFVGLVVLVGWLAIPSLLHQMAALQDNLDQVAREFIDWLRGVAAWLGGNPALSSLHLEDQVDKLASLLGLNAAPSGGADPTAVTNDNVILQWALGRLAGFAESLGHILLTGLLVLVFAVYILSDGPVLARGLRTMVPPDHMQEWNDVASEIGRVWSAYFRGQIITVIVFGVLTFLAMWALGLPSALLIGLLAGVLHLIPTLGVVMAGGAAVIMALIEGSSHLAVSRPVYALIVIAAFGVLLQIDHMVIQPKIMGRSVDLPGVVVIIGIALGAAVAGVLGAYLAVPVIATVRVLLVYLRHKVYVEPEVLGDNPPGADRSRAELQGEEPNPVGDSGSVGLPSG